MPVLDIEGLHGLRAFARQLAASLAPGQVWLLEGALGAGKTTLVREVCAALGIPESQIVSPTFTLVQEYEGGRLPVVHLDLYRIESGRPLDSLFLEEIFQRHDCVCFVEWPGVAARLLPPHARRLAIEFVHGADDRRRILTDAGDPSE
ncbi:MAG: tRNA (adenosine(37)-N6)-threonylcarbamoyltransferase complex ATPase subunit type 1 TsaE [Candidatus Wallbacteria bacterium]|nr:tRNA (adenosine(37)-N6)-threonylcarbamoyltransferase complex ATPase subunit type 1 TsaE [Candidatus Wallbacteria bacterium]